MSIFTDVLILINREDYKLALSRGFYAENIEYVNGVGVNLDKFIPQNLEMKQALRQKYSYQESDFILIYVAELRSRKNQDYLIKAISLLKKDIPNIRLLLVGSGELYEKYKKLIKDLKLEQNVKLMGYRQDVRELMLLSDLGVSSATREGLPVNVMEAMATGLPLVVSNCRGNRDLVVDGENGFVFETDEMESLTKKIITLHLNKDLANSFGLKNLDMINQYSISSILQKMEKIYIKVLDK